MEGQQEIFVFLSPEVQELLADNQVDLVDLLRQEGVTVQRGFAQDPTTSADAGHKEPVTIILASAALVVALTPLLTKLIEELSHEAVLVTEQVLVPVEDSQGNVVHDNAGKPVLHWVERPRIVESERQPREETAVDIKGPLGITIGYKSTPKG
jgi:hypothetical protein